MNEVEFYRDTAGDWRWRFVHANGNVMADSGQGYSRRIDAVNAARTVFSSHVGFTLDGQQFATLDYRPRSESFTLDDLHGQFGEPAPQEES